MDNNKRKRNKTKNQQAVRRRSHSHETQNPEEIELASRPYSVQQHADLRQDSGRQEYPSESRNLGHDRECQGQDPRQGGNLVEPAAPDRKDEDIGRLQRQIRELGQEIRELLQEIREQGQEIRELLQEIREQMRQQLADQRNRKWQRIFLFILKHFIMASILCVIILPIMAYTKKPSPTLIEYFLWVIISFFLYFFCAQLVHLIMSKKQKIHYIQCSGAQRP